MNTTKTIFVGIILAMVLVAGCAKAPETPAKTEGPIKLGWIGPMTGQSAVLGMDSITSAQIAVDEINAAGGINNRKVQLIAEDDQYDITKAVNSYNKLVNVDGVKIIVLNTYGSVFALSDRAKQDGVLLIDPLDCNSALTALGSHVFCLATDSESIGKVLSDQAKANGLKKIGIIHWNSDTFMPLVKDSFVKNYDGATVVEAYSAGTTDFKTTITKMQQQGVDGFALLGYDETGIAMKQARELGFKGLFFTTGTVTSPPLQEAAKGAANGTILAFWDAPKTQEPAKSFNDKFIAVKGRPPILDLASYPTYDTIKVLAIAIGTAGDSDTTKVGQALLGVQNYKGVTGDVSFPSDRAMRIQETAHILNNGAPLPVTG